MNDAPSSIAQLALVIAVVLPGVTYQLFRERARGSVPGERDVAERLLRALTASVVLDALYALVAGPSLMRLISPDHGFSGINAHPRLAGAACLGLVFAVPAAAACAVSRAEQRRRRGGTYEASAQRAWDWAFINCPPSFIRVHLKNGSWAGGWYGNKSLTSSSPEPPDLFLEQSWRLGSEGQFIAPVPGTQGLYLRGEDIDLLEILGTDPLREES